MEFVEYVEKYGFSWGLAALFVFFVVYYYKNLGPRLERIEHVIHANVRYDEELEKIAENSNKALAEVARSNDNVANSLNVLNITMTGQMEIMKMLYEDTKETQLRLYAHDDRSEKIYTMLRNIENIVSNNYKRREADE